MHLGCLQEGAAAVGGWGALFRRRYRRIMVLASSLPIWQQASGINTVVFYSSDVSRPLPPHPHSRTLATTALSCGSLHPAAHNGRLLSVFILYLRVKVMRVANNAPIPYMLLVRCPSSKSTGVQEAHSLLFNRVQCSKAIASTQRRPEPFIHYSPGARRCSPRRGWRRRCSAASSWAA